MISKAAMSAKRAGVKRSGGRAGAKASPKAPRGAGLAEASKPLSLGVLLRRGRRRVALVSLVFLLVMGAVAVRFADLAAQRADDPVSERVLAAASVKAGPARARIVDRNGLTLATDIQNYELYLDTTALRFERERVEAVAQLTQLFPDIDRQALSRRVARGGTAMVKRPVTPSMAQDAHNLGIPGLYFTPRLDRIYPGGAATSHVIGWTSVDGVGKAGIELGLEGRLSAEEASSLALSIDLRVQRAAREILAEAMRRFEAKAASAIVLSATTGETAALVSLPDYNPHQRPGSPTAYEDSEASPLFHRAANGRYELGSVFKIFTWALALETRVSSFDETFPPPEPLRVDKHTIRDDHPFPGSLNLAEAFAKSSNVIAAKLALRAGRPAQKRLFEALGLHEPTGLEAIEARGVAPSWNEYWSNTATATTAFGHGVAATPMHLAAATATIVSGGDRVRPTLLKQDLRNKASNEDPTRAITPQTSEAMRRLMRFAVTDGTGKAADAPGLRVGGKTGTAEKPDPQGGYSDDRVISTFVAAFPMDAPAYVVVIMLDEPTDMSTGKPRRGAGVTAAPVAGELISRIAPLLGVASRHGVDVAAAAGG